jgi:DNA-binding response OmpR family regulator
LRFRIAVLDDDQDCRDILKWFLEPHYEVETFETVEQLSSALREYRFNLILADLVVHRRYRGGEVLSFVRSLSEDHRAPVVLVTSDVPRFNEATAIDSGFDGFLLKPYEFEKMLDVINNLLVSRQKKSAVA